MTGEPTSSPLIIQAARRYWPVRAALVAFAVVVVSPYALWVAAGAALDRRAKLW